MEALVQDFRYGFRILRKTPGFAIVAVLTLALGIGANTAIFSVVNAVLVRALPFRDPQQLVLIREAVPKLGERSIPVSAPDVLDFQRQNRVFEAVAGFENLRLALSGIGEPERIVGTRVNAGLFALLGVQSLLGRTFTDEEDRLRKNVAVLSYGLWQRRFGADQNILGATLSLDRNPYTVVGVMPPGFEFPLRGIPFTQPAEIWVPMAFTQQELAQRGDNFNINVLARMKPGVSIARANADVLAIARRIQETYPPEVRGDLDLQALVEPLHEQIAGNVRTLLLVLLGAVGFVLLIGCANVANLLLARAAARYKEMAVRAALGAGRGQLLQQMLAESLTLALAGGAAGLLLAYWGARLFIKMTAGTLPRAQEISLDPRVLGFALLLSLVTSFLFGIAPYFELSAANLGEMLKEGSRSATGGPRRSRIRAALVVGEVALSLVLLVSAGLLIRSFERLRQTDPGFRPAHVLAFSLQLPDTIYGNGERVRSFFSQLLSVLQSLPGAQFAGAGTDLPLLANWTHAFTTEGRSEISSGAPPTNAHTVVFGNYFQALGIPLKRGRYFTDQDLPGRPGVLIINETMARRFWPGQDPIGKRLKWGLPQSDSPWLTIVGVVGDVKDGPMHAEPRPHTYEPYQQDTDASRGGLLNGLNIAVRAEGNPADLSAAARRQVYALDANLPVASLQTMEQVIDVSIGPRRFNSVLVTVFAAAALLLASIGLYGVIAYSVTQRTQEIGIRMAMGARPRDVLAMVLREGLLLAITGVVIGIAAALALTRLLSSLLFSVKSTDPATYVLVSAILIVVSTLASCIPAWRAARVDPLTALRYE